MAYGVGVYLIQNITNGKVYVGSSVHIGKRWRQHQFSLKRGLHSSVHLQNAWDKYGRESFVCRLVIECEESDLLCREQEVIDLYLAYDRECGYNICDQAGRPPLLKGIPKSEETRRRMSEAAQNRTAEYWRHQSETRRGRLNHMYGKKHSQEMIEVFRQKSTGKRHTEETRLKMSIAQRGERSHSFGRSPTQAQRTKQSAMSAMFRPEQVAAMREMRAKGRFWREIASAYGCSQTCAIRVVNGGRMAYAISQE